MKGLRSNRWLITGLMVIGLVEAGAQTQPGIPAPDARYKADILLMAIVPQQSALSDSRRLWVPLLLRNGSNEPVEVTIHADLPLGWTGDTKDRVFRLEPASTYPISNFLIAAADSNARLPQTLSWKATQGAITVAQVSLSVYLEYNGVPQ